MIEGKSSDGDTGSGDPPIDFLNMQEFPLTSVFGYRAGSDGVYPQWTQMVQKKKKPTGFITLPYSIQKEKSFAYSSTLSIDWLASSLVSELRFY